MKEGNAKRSALPKVFALAAALGVVGCANLETQWSDTLRANSIHGYREFLQRHTDSVYAQDARTRMARLEEYEENARLTFEKARRDDTIQAYVNAIGSYPRSESMQDRLAILTDLVAKQFPPWYRTSRIHVHHLANAVTNGQPYLVAAMPTYAAARRTNILSPKGWRVTTLFREIAGQPVTINDIDSGTWGLSGTRFRRTTDLPEGGIGVPAGGTARHTWLCQLEPLSMTGGFDLSAVEIRYEYADNRWVPRRRHKVRFHDAPFLLEMEAIPPSTLYDRKNGQLCESKRILDVRQEGAPSHQFPWEFCVVDVEGLVLTWRNTGIGDDRVSVDVDRHRLSSEELLELKVCFRGLPRLRHGRQSGGSSRLGIWFGDGDALGYVKVNASSPGPVVARILDICRSGRETRTSREKDEEATGHTEGQGF